MKKLFILIAGLITICFSCKKETSNLDPTSSQNMMPGSGGPNVRTAFYVWRINSFIVNGNDLTTELADYKFDIQAPQLMTGVYTIVAVNSSNTYYGKWNRVSYGEVIINFPTNVPVLSQLNDDWTLTNNQQYDVAMQSSAKTLSFHANGETWPSDK